MTVRIWRRERRNVERARENIEELMILFHVF
jgi:hypothetical protein